MYFFSKKFKISRFQKKSKLLKDIKLWWDCCAKAKGNPMNRMGILRKSQTNEKSILFWKLCWLLSSEEIWSTSDFSFSQVTSVEKREPRKHFSASACSFLGLGLRPRPQKSGFGFEKLFLGSLFSTSVTWEKLKSDVDKFFLRVASTIFKTKYYWHELIFLRLLW